MRFEILVFDGVDELDAVGPYEVLASAARLVPWSVGLVVLPRRPLAVTGRHGLALRAQAVVSDDADILIVTGGGWVDASPGGIRGELARGDLVRTLVARATRGHVTAAVCTGAMALGSAGLLRGRPASTHHLAAADLAAMGAVPVAARVVDDGDVVTAGGVTSGIDLALWLVERFAGPDLAARVSERLEHRRRVQAFAPGRRRPGPVT